MTELTRAVWAESLKLKRTLALRLAVIAPLFIVLLQLGVYLARGEDVERAASNPAARICTWNSYIVDPPVPTLLGNPCGFTLRIARSQ
jgi:hypothetical protein